METRMFASLQLSKRQPLRQLQVQNATIGEGDSLPAVENSCWQYCAYVGEKFTALILWLAVPEPLPVRAPNLSALQNGAFDHPCVPTRY